MPLLGCAAAGEPCRTSQWPPLRRTRASCTVDGTWGAQGVLSKLNAAKELMKEFIEREKRKAKEREDAKSEATKAAEAKKEEEQKESDKESKPATDVLKA